MAEREGFEPSKGYNTLTPLAGERFRPLSHLSESTNPIMTPKGQLEDGR